MGGGTGGSGGGLKRPAPRIVIEPHCTRHKRGYRLVDRVNTRLRMRKVWQCDECIAEARERFRLIKGGL